MTPFGDTMGFVYSDSRQLALGVYRIEVFPERIGQGVFGGDVEQASMWMAWKFLHQSRQLT